MGRRGFTLLEMVVATAIMGIAVAGLLSGLAASTRNAARLRDYDRASQLARLRMNELLLDERLERNVELTGDFDTATGFKAGWRARLSPFEMPPVPAPGLLALDRIQLEVWWNSGSVLHSLNLEGYRRHVLAPADIPPPPVMP